MTEYIKFVKHGEPIMTIYADGRITLREDAQPTEAAAACIEAMSDMIQNLTSNAVQAERDATVAWLRSDRIVITMDGSAENFIATAIEVGEHLKEYGK
jgi:hypothetical protein